MRTGILSIALAVCALTGGMGHATPYSMEISFTNFAGRGTLTNFPMLLKFDQWNIAGYDGFLDSANGYDLRLWTNSSQSGAALDYEFESFDATGETYVWVRMPSFTQGTSIWASWGDDATQQASTTNGAVWDSRYKGVWHANGTVVDSTVHANDATADNAIDVSGAIADGKSFNGSNQAVELGDLPDFDLTEDMTLSAWVNPDVASAGRDTIFGKWGDSYIFNLNSRKPDGYIDGWQTGNTQLVAGAWALATMSFDDTSNILRFFVNGDLDREITGYNGNSGTSGTLYFGQRGNSEWFHGLMDEFRMSDVLRSTNWLWASYMSQGDAHDTFVSYGAVDLPGDVNWTGEALTAVSANALGVQATVDTALTTATLLWDTSNQGIDIGAWSGSSALGAQSAGTVNGTASTLTSDTQYVLRFFGTNSTLGAWGWSVPFSYETGLTGAQAPVFTNAATEENSIRLGWQDNANYETAYILKRSSTGSGGPYTELATLPPNTESYWDTVLAPGTYHYRLAATNANTTSGTDFALAQTSGLSKAADLFASGPSGIVAPPQGTLNPVTGVNWAFGDLYHLVFVSSSTTDLVGDHPMPHWNRHVNALADTSPTPGLSEASWYALASTFEVDARDNAVVSAPVYLVNGSNLVATGFSDLWDGSIAIRITIDENGAGGYSGNLWTGSEANGRKQSSRPLDAVNGTTQAGAITGSDNWFANRWYNDTDTRRFYVMSQPLMITNGAPDSTPPSPTNMTWASAPVGLSAKAIEMHASVAHDLASTPVEYYFENRTTGASSGWQLSEYYVDTVLARQAYTYRVKARDASGNETGWSEDRATSPVIYGRRESIRSSIVRGRWVTPTIWPSSPARKPMWPAMAASTCGTPT